MSRTLTILVPALNASATVSACIASILADPLPAGFDEREVILVDNGSTDNTAALARRAGARVFRCRRRGQGPARNTGFRRSRGEIILCTDSDCTVVPGWAAAMVAAFDDPRVAVAGGEIEPGRLESAAERHAAARRLLSQEDAMRGFPGFYLPFAITANAAFRRSALDEVGHFDETIHPAEDADLSWRMQIAGWRLRHVPESRVLHFHRATTLRYWRQIYGYGVATAGLFAKYSDRMRRRVWLGLDYSGDIRRTLQRLPLALLRGGEEREFALLDLATQTAALAGRIVGSVRHGIILL